MHHTQANERIGATSHDGELKAEKLEQFRAEYRANAAVLRDEGFTENSYAHLRLAESEGRVQIK